MKVGIAARDRLQAAIEARRQGRDDEARALLVGLVAEYPDDAQVNLQCAWIHDKLGLEAEAVPFYEAALRLGLGDEDLPDALLGLGSTYRALGRYQESLATLDRAVAECPDDLSLRVFRALTLYNVGRSKESCESLLSLLVETTNAEDISRYREALAEYAADLDRIWP